MKFRKVQTMLDVTNLNGKMNQNNKFNLKQNFENTI